MLLRKTILGLAILALTTATSSTALAWQIDLPAGHEAVVDADGNVVVVGVIYYDGGDHYSATKLSSVDGSVLWQRDYAGGRDHDGGGSGAIHGYVYAARVDGAGNVVLAGKLGPDPATWRVMKLDGGDGSELWRWDAPNWMVDAAIDFDGNVAVSGTGGNTSGPNSGSLWVAKLDASSGARLWYREIGCDFHVGCGYMNAVTFDASGDVVGAGYLLVDDPAGGNCFEPCGPGFCPTPCSGQLLVAKFDGDDGAELWRTTTVGTLRDVWVASPGNAVVVDPNGDVLAGGSLRNVGAGGDAAVVKLGGSDGQELWRWQVNGSGNGDETVGGLAVDAAGNVVMTADLVETFASKTLHVAKISGASGATLWQTPVVGDTAVPLFFPTITFFGRHALEIEPDGNVLATGSVSNATTARDFVIAKLAGNDGSELWRHTIDGTSDYPGHPEWDGDVGRVVAVDSTGAVLAAGLTDNGGSESSENHPPWSFTVVKLAGENVSGESVLLRDSTDARKKRLKLESRDAALYAPAPGGSSDPTLAGASLVLFNPLSGETDVYDLPHHAWSGLGSPRGSRGYRYVGDTGACRKVSLQTTKRSARMKADCRGSGIAFTLDEPSQGEIGISISFGADASRHTMLFGGTVRADTGMSESPSSSRAASGVGVFQAENAPALPLAGASGP
jgi:hypothetical protein